MGVTIDGSSIDQLMETAVSSGRVPHIAAIIADHDGIRYEGGAGAVTTSTQFQIKSMTKMICTAAALRQLERGQLDLKAPVDTYCPEFAEVPVLDGWDGDTPKLRAPATRATVEQLITHTSGLGYSFWNAELLRYAEVTAGSSEVFSAPLVADPGTRFEYGTSTDWLGKVIESVAGTTLDVVIKEGVTGPLGMNDTMFSLDEARKANCARVHVKGEDGRWAAMGELPADPDWFSGGSGLYSTPRDYIRFERALLRGGELDGERILDPETVDAAFTNQIGELDFPTEIPTATPSTADSLHIGPGWKWGYGLLLNTADRPGGRKAGSGGWSGLFNTHFFIDRATGICASIYTNSLPFISEHEAWRTYLDFETALYAAM